MPIFNEKFSQAETADNGCGDGLLDTDEDCDDGNLDDGDDCSSSCKMEDASSAVYPCSDSLDNDNDGLLDAEDPGCHTDWNADNDASYNPTWVGEYEIDRVSVSTDGIEANSGSVVAYKYYVINGGRYFMVETGYYVSDDGRYVVFMSAADNLVEDDGNHRVDIFLRDRLLGTTKRINAAPDGTDANGTSMFPSISADGNYILFYSNSTNLVSGGSQGSWRWYIYDLRADMILSPANVSKASPVSEGNISFPPSYMGGKYLAFYSPMDGLVEGDNDGRYDVFIINAENGEIRQVSKAYDGTESDGNSVLPTISKDGRYVVFTSDASNLVAGDSNGKADVFVYDTESEAIVRVSLGVDGTEGTQHSIIASLSPNGQYAAFYSNSWNLVPDDQNEALDVFVVKNLLFQGANAVPLVPAELRQANGADGAEVSAGKIINEGADESADSVILSAKVEDPDGGRVALEVQIESVDEVSGEWTQFEPVRSEYVSSGETAVIEYHVPRGGLYTWRAKAIDESGGESDFAHFADNGTEADFISSNFSFVFLTDVHLGSLTTVAATIVGENWYESQSYPRFTDVLYDIEQLNPRPDLILIGGDNVEYNNIRWLKDFKSIIEGYTTRTGIEIYFVPGNHDRYDSESSALEWGETDLSGGNDYLRNYFEVMKSSPKGVISLFDGEPIMTEEISREGGYNKYNYYFNHKGLQFIGLDSGEDTGVADLHPESKGINIRVINALEHLQEVQEGPGVIFMHSPIYNSGDSWEWDNGLSWEGDIVPDASIVNNWLNFITFCNGHNIQLVLSGHEHNDFVTDKEGNPLDLSSWIENKTYPLYLQTQSAGKDDNHGYRIIDVENGKAIPQEPKTGVTKYEKIFSDLDSETDLELLSYDGGGTATTFTATDSDRKIIYDYTAQSGFTVKNDKPDSTSYDLQIQKREAGTEIKKDYAPFWGYKIVSPELCNPDNLSECDGKNFVYLSKDQDYTILGFENVGIKGNSSSLVSVNWSELNNPNVFWEMDGLTFVINGNYADLPLFKPTPVTFTADLNSPGELRVIDSEGNITGLVDGEIVEDIPYSIYVSESATVYVFGDTRQEIVEGLKTQVVGSYEATYDLTLSLSENGEEKAKFAADDILTNDKTIHQFGVDWDVLSEGGSGVTMQFDEDGIEGFERDIASDGSLSFPKAILNAVKYEANEGMETTLDASGSSDSDGSIALYEWDFDGDGIYDASSTEPIIFHIYGDDFSGKAFLKVTDDEGLTDRSSIVSAEVIITNVNPAVSISRFEIRGLMDKAMSGDSFADFDVDRFISGKKFDNISWWTTARPNEDMMSKFVLEGDLGDAGWLDTHIVSIDWGDGSMDNDIPFMGENLFPDATGKISASHRYTELKNYVVKLTVTDDDGGTTTSEITLKGPRQLKQSALSELKSIQTDNKNIRKELDKTISSLEESLADRYWKDDFHLNMRYSAKFFVEEKKAIFNLKRILMDKKRYADFRSFEEIREIIDELNDSDIFLVKIMVYETEGLDVKDSRLGKEWIGRILGLDI